MKKLLLGLSGLLCYVGFAQTGTLQKYIVVDQFGYRPGDDKVAIIADPQQGFNASDSFTPGNTYEVRRLSDDAVMLSGSPVQWNNGATDPDNGDRGWWFDFSLLDQNGDYYIYDVQRNRHSHVFHVGDNVYEDVLKAAMRTYYYQRLSNTGNNITKSFGDDPWKFSGIFRKQDNNAIDVNNQVASTARDMSGGWMDAGDSNKYVTFATVTVHQLLTSYMENQSMWNNLDLDIPESNNSTPDILDEVKWELDWLLKMQDSDGGVFIKIGQVGFPGGDITNDNSGAFYEKKCSSSSLAAASMYAHGSMVFQSIGMNSYASTLKQAAIDAWDWFANSSKNNRAFNTECDPKAVRSGDADRGLATQKGYAASAAIYLWQITGNNNYHNEFLNYYDESIYTNEKQTEWGMYDASVSDAFEYYLTLNNTDSGAVSNILSARNMAVNDAKFVITSNEHLYRADNTQDHWGNTKPRANIGNSALKFRETNANSSKNNLFKKRALNILHGFHGVNALQMAYLSNMKSSSRLRWGAENSVNAIFHTMFKDGSNFDNAAENNGPAPGYVTGGPNRQWVSLVNNPDPYKVKLGAVTYDALLKDQPKDKLYSDNVDAWDDALSQLIYPYALNENSITYQSAYIKLLANFVGKNSGSPSPDDDLGESDQITTSLPATIERGKSTSISINYSATENGNIFMSLLDSSTDPYSDVGEGVSASANVSAGGGVVTLQLDVPENTPLGTNYAVYLNMFNSDYSRTLAAFPTTDIEVVENTGGENPTDNSISATIPSEVNPGQTVTLSVSYTAAANANIFAQLFDTSGSEWVSYGDGSSQAVSPGSGTATLAVEIPANTPLGNDYILYLNMFNEDWSSTLASFPNTSVSVIDGNPGPGDGDVVIRARGTCGSETMELRVDGTVVQTWNNIGTSFANYTYSGFSGGAIRVNFTNDGNVNGCDRNLDIDKITVCDEVYETEDTAVKGPGCGDGDSLWCTGYFDFGNISCEGEEPPSSGTTYYYIKNKELGDYLRPASADNNAQILVESNDNSDWFQWEKVATSDGYFYLKNKESGKYFRPADNVDVKTNGSVMQQKPTGWDGSYTQWTEVDSGDGTYVHLANRQTGLYFRALDEDDRYLVARPTGWSGSWTRWVFEPVTTSFKAKLPAQENIEMLLYPNPAKNQLNITGNVQGAYTIYDISGKSVKTGILSEKTAHQIDITPLGSGMYLLSTPQKAFKFIKE